MIIEDIKDSIRNALHSADENIIFHFEEVKHTGFPYVILELKDFKVEPCAQYTKQKYEFMFEIVYMKSEQNKIIELLEAQNLLKEALLPVISVKGKKITPDEVNFSVENKKLVMKFKMILYVAQTDDTEQMQTLDISYKGEK